MRDRILVLDGAMGTMLQGLGLTAQDFGGPELEGCNEHLVLTRPEAVLGVHRAYLAAGADIVETDTFGGSPIVLAEYGLAAKARELNRRAAGLARRAVDEATTAARPRFVAGSMGPTTKAISVTGGVSFSGLVAAYEEQALGLLEGGVDIFFVETCQDTRNAKAALIAIDEVCREAGTSRPVVVSATIEPTGAMLAGQRVEAFVASIGHADLLAVGINCATGPEFMTDHLRSIHEVAPWPVSCFPNAGLPDEEGCYGESPAALAAALGRFVDLGWLNLVGGCCGTTEEHVAAIAQMVDGRRPRAAPAAHAPRSFYSGIELVEATADTTPLLVGERTNVIGSRRFRCLVAEERWDDAAEIARRQVSGGAQIVDVCLQSTERDEVADVHSFYERLTRAVKVPIMIDSTDAAAVEAALTYCQGKAIVNSVNLEDGDERFDRICPLLRKYGAAVVVGAIDDDPEQAQAFTRERKLEVARRSHGLLTGRYGLREEDLIFDPLVFPAASGDAAYIGGAVETIEGLRLIKKTFPACRTVLGISNVSFGLPPGAREVVNSVFLYHCTLAGLDLAIVNTQGIERLAAIPEAERRLAEDLLFNTPPAEMADDAADRDLVMAAPADWRQQTPEQRRAVNQLHITRLVERLGGGARARRTDPELPLDQRLSHYVVDGSRDGLVEDLRRKLDEGAAPLDIVNGPLMSGMAEVGRLFNSNQLIVAEVLQSAESMKAAVSFLEGFMARGDAAVRGRLVLATVKGDVHDIGKNLVEIILANSGFEVIDLGIKVPPERLVEACREHRPDAIGLSGLLVKSALQMVATAEDLAAAGIDVPILVGGAALSQSFTERRIAPVYTGPVEYCGDAMAGLEAMKRIVAAAPGGREVLAHRPHQDSVAPGEDGADCVAVIPAHERTESHAPAVAAEKPSARAAGVRRRPPRRDNPPLPAPVPGRQVVQQAPELHEIWGYVNPQMLYGKHLGLRGAFARKLAARDPKAVELHTVVEALQQEAQEWMRVRAVWRFLEAEAEAETVLLYEPGGVRPVHVFTFPRQPGDDGLCLADYVLPSREGVRDSVALFVVTAGAGVREHADAAKTAGEYLKSHAIQALAVETAEAAAEWLHARLRAMWGFPDPAELTMQDRFAARYRGRRYSFGYPACPDLDDQRGIWKLLNLDEIGVSLTEGMMMDPEASVSAIVLHHPDCTYFSARGTAR